MPAYRALVAELLKLAGKHSPLAGLSVDEVESDSGGLIMGVSAMISVRTTRATALISLNESG